MSKAFMLLLTIGALTLAACGSKSAVPGPTPTPILYQGCPVTPVQHSLFEPANPPITPNMPWIQATPVSSGITGHLDYSSVRLPTTQLFIPLYANNRTPSGNPTVIWWIIGHETNYSDSTMGIHATQLSGGHGSFFQTYQHLGLQLVEADVNVPSPGCWQLSWSTGHGPAQ